MLLGHARGKVGSLVFSRSNGQQVTRARAEVVKNPRTRTQLIQRIILNTVSQAYSKMNAIVDHSFEGIAPGQASMAYFNRKGLQNLRSKISAAIADNQDYDSIVAFAPLKSNYFCPNDFEIAKGTLPEIKNITTAGSTNAAIALPGNTYQDIIDQYGLQRGDQLTFITIQGTLNSGVDFHFARVILDPINDDMTPAPLSTAFVSGNAVVKPNGRNEGEFAALAFDTDKLNYKFSQKPMCAAAVIVSRKGSDGSWKRSNATLYTYGDNIIGFFPSLQEALDAAESDSLDALNARYLNNSGTGRVNGQTYTPPVPVTISGVTINGTTLNQGATLAMGYNAQSEIAATIVATLTNTDENYKVRVYDIQNQTVVQDAAVSASPLTVAATVERDFTYGVYLVNSAGQQTLWGQFWWTSENNNPPSGGDGEGE